MAAQMGLLMIPEFTFDHCIYQLSQDNLRQDPATQIAEVYRRCASFLRISTKPNLGVTVLMSPRWFFLCTLSQPYAHADNGHPVYLDGFDFAGLFTLQTTSLAWPASAGLEDQTISILKALSESTKVVKIFDEDELIQIDAQGGGRVGNI